MLKRQDIEEIIPHREPFLLVDKVTAIDSDALQAEFIVDSSSGLFGQIFPGHYPGNPITPGVILCEVIFQAGAILMGHRLRSEEGVASGSPVVTRIRDARFKQMVKPGDILEIMVEFEDQVSSAYYLKGSIKVAGKLAVRVAFTCALITD